MNIDDKVLMHVRLLLQEAASITEPVIHRHIENVEKMLGAKVENAEKLVRELMSKFNVWVDGNAAVLTDEKNHVVWLPDKKAEIKWHFWKRYKNYLRINEGFSRDVVNKLDTITDRIIGLLEDPERKGYWDRRGMVMGQVQSGKTANYTGLICKAADAGYKVIIVLAGMHNDLRSQTQIRLDIGFLGRDTRKTLDFSREGQRIGVGAVKGFVDPAVHSLTSSADDGDFKTNVARNILHRIDGEDPVILVVKKNATVLRNVLAWLENFIEKDSGQKVIKNNPIFVIDDEADNASVDGRAARRDEFGNMLEDEDPTKINRQIRRLLNIFQQVSYVGYTATPFANIFIYPKDKNAEEKEWGEDLFPKSFIINLPTPDNYVGPCEVFGIEKDAGPGLEEKEGLPIVRIIDDFSGFMPEIHKKDHQVPKEIPDSLEKAMKCFILSCAARIARGQEKEHNSMLVHVTRYTAVQKQIVDLLNEKLTYLRNCIELDPKTENKGGIREYKELWESDYVPATKEVKNKFNDPVIVCTPWKEIEKLLFKAASKIQVKEINGESGDVLDYVNHPNGLSVIAVGGDRLSRGLTLYGLTISYYLRASKMYDTLMQMGRWFGYRPGYVDLCRLFTSYDLFEWYQYIASATEELRGELDRMEKARATPEEFGLRVRNHPGVLQVTATNKIRSGIKMTVTFADSLCETVHFKKDRKITENNFRHIENWLISLGKHTEVKKGSYLWRNVSGEKINDMLELFIVHPLCMRADPKRLKQYIQSQLKRNELTYWTVALISITRTENKHQICGIETGLSNRGNVSSTEDRYSLSKNHLISRRDEYIDLNDEEYNEALENSITAWRVSGSKKSPIPTEPSGPFIRAVRNKASGLLLIYLLDLNDPIFKELAVPGYAISFPASKTAGEIEYVVNTNYWRQNYGDD